MRSDDYLDRIVRFYLNCSRVYGNSEINLFSNFNRQTYKPRPYSKLEFYTDRTGRLINPFSLNLFPFPSASTKTMVFKVDAVYIRPNQQAIAKN